MYSRITNQIKVTVYPIYLENQSEPNDNHYVWAYHIKIENLGKEIIQLRTRYWRITDSLGRTQEIQGVGVIGEQPTIKPGEVYEYTSGTPLSTPSGVMEGWYQMVTEEGDCFEVEIPAFSLDSPYQLISMN